MKVILTTVKSASVFVDKKVISQINRGLLLLIGVENGDSEKDVIKLTEKISKVRVFPDQGDKLI